MRLFGRLLPEMIRYVPNALTLFRFACLPVFVWIYGWQAPGFAWKAALLMWFATWSDLADGYIARKYNAVTRLGQVLDPLVDRAFFLTAFGAYVYYGTMPWWAVAPVVGRDVLLIVASAVLVGSRRGEVQVLRSGKWATFVLAWSVGFFMIGVRFIAWPLYIVGGALYLYTGCLYVMRYFRARRARPAAV